MRGRSRWQGRVGNGQWATIGLGWLLGVILLVAGAWGMPPVEAVWGDGIGDRNDAAMVALDGRSLFVLHRTVNRTAQERVQVVERSLNQWVTRQMRDPNLATDVAVQEVNDQSTIQINQELLLTVTERDLQESTSPVTQAAIWRVRIEEALKQAVQERSPDYQYRALVQAAAILGGAVLGSLLLTGVLSWADHRWVQAGRVQPESWPQVLALLFRLRWVLAPALLWGVSIYGIAELFPWTRSLRYELLVRSFTEPLLALGDRTYALFDILAFAGSLVLLWFGARTLARLLKMRVLAQAGADRAAQEALGILLQYSLVLLGLIVILQIWGLDVGSLAIAASVLGVGISLGLQDIAKNFISGLIVILERPIQVGDFVAVGDLVGTVERIGARSTEISTPDRITIVVPNSRFLENETVNWSHGSPVSRLSVSVGVSYGSPVQRVQRALLEAAHQCPLVLTYPKPQVWFQAFGDSSLNFDLQVWINEPRQQDYIKSELNYQIHAALGRYRIEIPFPQRDLHLRSPQVTPLLEQWLDAAETPTLLYDAAGQPLRRRPPVPEPSADSLPPEEPLPSVMDRLDPQQVVIHMQRPGGVAIRDHRYRFSLYSHSFVGTEALAWLMQTYRLPRDRALQLGQTLLDQGWIRNLTHQSHFQDAYILYRFTAAARDLLAQESP